MSRWICIDDVCIPSDENDWEELVAFADAIAEQEPIDIVRCGECKHENSCEHQVLLSTMWNEVEDTADIEYCSYGEREEGE